MITVRKAQDRGHFNFGWLDTYHSFSFGEYFDPQNHQFRALRVINEDWVGPGAGFPTHPHRDMEIVTYVLEGALEHRDSMGNGSVIRPGDVQRMSAGTGITHSEFNPSPSERTHLLQIWLLPARKGLTPSYEQVRFDRAALAGKLRLVASPDGREDSVTIHQDAGLYAGVLDGEPAVYPLAPGRHAWVQVARGAVTVNGQALQQGDGAALSEEGEVRFSEGRDAEVLLFDLA